MSLSLTSESVHGVTVPLVTPFDSHSLDVDHVTLAALADRLVDEGAACLLAADLVGESWALTAAEKVAVVRTVADANGERVPIITKLSESSGSAQVALAREVAAAGAHIVKIGLPRGTAAADEQSMFRWLTAPAEAAGVPFLVEGYSDVPDSVLESLCRHELFLGYEEASRDLVAFLRVSASFGNSTAIIAGSEDVLPGTLLCGAHGLMTATPNFALKWMKQLFISARSGDVADTLARFRQLQAYRSLFFDELERGVSAFVPYTKESLTILGNPVGPPRPPLIALTSAKRQALHGVLEHLGMS